MRRPGGFAVCLLLLIGGLSWLLSQDPRPAAEAPRAAPQVSAADAAVFRAQPALLEASLAALKPERPGVPDLYFVGFGGYAPEDVFMKEVIAIDELFREPFDAEGRTVSLINNPQTAAVAPVASAANLGRVLRHIGGIMNREEDVLVLYLTTHGSEQHRLAVVNWPLKLQDIDPPLLRRLLDESGIKWRVVAISACYSGGFIEPLQSETTLIMTAADAGRQSFGCGAESEFTYFGRALFDEELRATHSFTMAFERARRAIAERERAGKHAPSNPQIAIGGAIAGKLRDIEARLQAQAAAARAAEAGW